jgi:FixJ family two-component response regulator
MSTEPTVFVVDDDQAMRSSLEWLIESIGMKVKTYGSADDFLSSYYPGRAGCLLLDVRMPGMSGLELQAHLAREDSRLPVIIITGHGDVSMAVKAMKAGFKHPERPRLRREAALAPVAKGADRHAPGGAHPA